MNLKRNDGITLIEIMLALVIMVFVISAGSGWYLSNNNMAQGMITNSSAFRNAQIATMHIEKNVRDAASNFHIDSSTGNLTLTYRIYRDALDVYSGPSITCRYEFDSTAGEIRYYPDLGASPATYNIVSSHITNCNLSIESLDGVVLHIEITALDNEDGPESACTLSTCIEATATSSPAVFLVS